MTDTLLRLAWALPLVMAVGAVIMLALKRFVVPASLASRQTQRMHSRESLSLSDDTRLHLVEVDGRAYLVVESTRQTVLQSALPHTGGGEPLRPARGAAWMQRLYQAGSR